MTMKRIKLGWMAVLVFGGVTMAAVGQTSDVKGAGVKDDLFAGTEMFAKGASDVTEITMDPDTLGMVAGKDKSRAHNMVLNVVRTYSYDKPGMYRIEDVEAFRDKLNTGDWHCSVHTRDLKRGESTDICNKRRTDDLSETAIITVEPKELTFIHTIRKKSATEPGEMGMMPLMYMHGLTSLAMLDPEAFVDMKLALRLPMLEGAPLRLHIDSEEVQRKVDEAMRNAPKVDGGEIQRAIDEARKAVDGGQTAAPKAPVVPEGPVAPKQPE